MTLFTPGAKVHLALPYVDIARPTFNGDEVAGSVLPCQVS